MIPSDTPNLLTAEMLKVAERPPAARPDWYMVLAYYSPGKFWKLQREYRTTIEAAQKAASNMSRGWMHFVIVKIPGTMST